MPAGRRQEARRGTADAERTLRMTRWLLERHPARITGTPECRAAARSIAEKLGEHCSRVSEEPFDLHPGSLWNVGRILATCYVASLLLLLAGRYLAFAAVGVACLGMVYGCTIYILYGKGFDWLFPRAEGRNVCGIIEPSAEVTRQVLVVGHHDGPYNFSFLLRAPQWAGIRLIAAMAAYLFMVGSTAYAAVALLLGAGGAPLSALHLWLLAAGCIFVVPLFFLVTGTPSPGAGDNLNTCSMGITLAAHFTARGKEGAPLRHTRLVILSTDGEEAGQRGAIAYVDRHLGEMRALPTWVLNIDSVYKTRYLAALTRDRNGTLPLSRRMAEECRRLAGDLGYTLPLIPLPLGGGGTDAAQFARRGIECASIVGLPISLVSGDIVYHTPRDTVEAIAPEAVEAVIDLAIAFVSARDRETCPLEA
jgi:aminopeptidase YwaD